MTVTEASLTGESTPVLKDAATLPGPVPLADRTNMVFSGTAVTRGAGRALITATGMRTEIGRLASLLSRAEEPPTPLQREIDLVGRKLGMAAIVIAAVVVMTILVTFDVREAAEIVEILVLGVSLAVAAVPEGLPTILTIVLALGVHRMARQRAIVKKLSSVETLGSTSVICSDKTGTLTKNEMTIQQVITRSGGAVVTGVGYRPDGEVIVDGEPLCDGPLLDEVRIVLCGGSLANDAVLHSNDGEWTVRGDPTDAAFLVAARKLDIAHECADRFTRLAEVPFSSERKRMSVIAADARRGGRPVLVTKGAPDVLLALCTREGVGDRTSTSTTSAGPRSRPRCTAWRTRGCAPSPSRIDRSTPTRCRPTNRSSTTSSSRASWG